MRILAIDPGNEQSGVVVWDNKKVLHCKKWDNNELKLSLQKIKGIDLLAIEMIASYGMPVGATVFDTCVWIGRFIEIVDAKHIHHIKVYRKDVKMHLCHSMKAKDSNVTQALVDRFATSPKNHGKGTKKDPGFFYGFKKDIWQAFGVAVTAMDNYGKNSNR